MKHKKLVVGITITILASGVIGGILMAQMKTPFDIFLIKDFTKPTKDEQINYLKKYEHKMTDYVKSENSKVESVQWDWDRLDVGVAGNGTPQGAGIYLDISGKFNDIEESKLTMTWQLKDEKSFPKISAMYLTDVSVEKNGGWVDYE